MTATYEPTAAGEVYSSALEPSPRGRIGRAVCSALDLWCAMTGGVLELTSAADVVVRRRSDAGEELRVAGGPPSVSLGLLEQVRADLVVMGPDEFRSEWGID